MVILEGFFQLSYYFGMDWRTFYNFPITYKKWLVSRISKEFKDASDNKREPMSKAAHHHDPQMRALTGKARPQVPANMRGRLF